MGRIRPRASATLASSVAAGITPVIDTEVALADIAQGLSRLEGRQVFGKIIVTF